MAVPLYRGNPSLYTFTASLSPTENGTVTINIGPKYNFLAGLSVIVSTFFNGATRFEAIVQSYSGGSIVLEEITNIQGTWPASGTFTMTIVGERGSKIMSGVTAPSNSIGRIGDMYIDEVTGKVYIKKS